MNRIHRKIWSRSLGAFIAVAETTRSRGKAGGGGGGVSGSVGGAWVATVLLGQALAGGWAHAGPQGSQLAAGSGSIAQAGTGNNTVTTITQTSPRMVINWNSFNIGAGESVTFRQPDASAIALNRVLGSGASQIDGSLTANGQVWLLNPSGVLFGRNAQVSGGGLLASTLGLSDASFMAGQYRFSADGSQGSVVNQGSLTGGYVALLGKQVVNSGSIVATGSGTGTAQTGGAAMVGAGDAMTLNFDGQRLLNLQVDRGSYQALVDNQGLVQADDGQVRLTAHAKDALLATVVNNSGIVQARGVRSHGGTIELLGAVEGGGAVRTSGTLDTSATTGGSRGGTVRVLGQQVAVEAGARVNASGPGGGGTILVGGSWQNSDASVPQAQQTTVAAGTLLQANATERGDGGTVVVWSDIHHAAGSTQAHGRIEATAGLQGGDGGRIETSGHRLDTAGVRVNASAPQGRSGQWLLDPSGITIVGSGSTTSQSNGNGLPNYLAANGDSVVLASDIQNALTQGGGTDVTLQTDIAPSGSGDITVNAPITWNQASRLTLNAHGNIAINADITAQHANGQVALIYGQHSVNGSGYSYSLNGSRINLQAGNNFFTQQGSSGGLQGWRVITQLGAAGSTTGTDLQGINGGLAGRYVLGGDIDASATAAWNNGAGFAPLGDSTTPFTGRLDGLGRSISGLTINRPSTDNVGLIGAAGTVGAQPLSISRVGLVDAQIVGRDQVGALVGRLQGPGLLSPTPQVSDSHAGGSVTGRNYVGGLVGLAGGGALIVGSSYLGSVAGDQSVGGLAGMVNSGRVEASHAAGTVSAVQNGVWRSYIGGLVGSLLNINGMPGTTGIVTTSSSKATVSGGANVGGLIGDMAFGARVTDAYATGRVSAQDAVGGLVGLALGDAGIERTYTSGAVQVIQGGIGRAGGILGISGGDMNGAPSIDASYHDTASTGRADAIGDGSSLAGARATVNDSNRYGRAAYAMLGTWGAPTNGVARTSDVGRGAWVMLEGETRPMLASEHSSTIRTANQLQLMAMDLTARYTLANNIDASETAANMGMSPVTSGMWSSSGFVPVGDSRTYFTGRLDGLGHTISGLTINRPSTNFVGLVGLASAATIQNTGLMGGSVSGAFSVGGLVGYSFTSIVSNSYATGSVSGTAAVGGLVGYNDNISIVRNSYATGSVSRTGQGASIGGLVGVNYSSTVINSYATGMVAGTGDNVGGLVGYSNSSTMNSSYWSITTSGQTLSAGGTGLTTAQMLQASSFSGWSIDRYGDNNSAVWRIYEGSTAPLLRSFMTPLTVTQTGAQTSRGYNGLTAVTGASYTYSTVPNSQLLGTVRVDSVSPNAGTQNTYLQGLYSTQLGYDIRQTAGSVTITPKLVTLTAPVLSKVYDGGLGYTTTPADLTALSSQLGVVGDSVSAAQMAYTGSANAGTGNRTAALNGVTIADGNGGNNYSVTLAGNSSSTINRRALTVTANDAQMSVARGVAFSGGNGVSFSAFAAGGTAQALAGSVTYAGTAQGASAPGSYLITVAGLLSDNYAISYLPGTLTLTSSFDGRAALDDVLGALHGSGGRASLGAVKPLMALEDVLTIAPGTDATPMATSAP